MMENLPQILEIVQEEFFRIIGTMILNGVGYSVLGLVSAIALLIFARRKGLFNRPYGFWTFLVKLNYLYLPLLFMLLGGIMGTIRGAEQVTNRAMAGISGLVDEYLMDYVAQIQVQLPKETWILEEDMTLEEMVRTQTAQHTGLSPNSYPNRFVTKLNLSGWTYLLDALEVPEALRNPIDVYRILTENRETRLAVSSLDGYCQSMIAHYFGAKYIGVWMIFLPFLIVPVAECTCYQLLASKKDTPKP